MIKQAKNYPLNNHHDGYDSKHGWAFLGSDDDYDYYVNHSKKWTSIVPSNEDSSYISPDYEILLSGDEANMIMGTYNRHPHTQLKQLIIEAAS
jgi:hypothetical protein